MVKKRTKAFSAIFATIAAVLLFSISISVVYATKPVTVDGTFTTTNTYFGMTRAGESDNVIIDLSVNAIWTGDIAGSSTSDSRWVLHYLPFPGARGTANMHGLNTMSATVDGKSGTLTILITGRVDKDLVGDGTWQIISGTNDLTNLHGRGTWGPSGTVGVDVYTGQIHWDP